MTADNKDTASTPSFGPGLLLLALLLLFGGYVMDTIYHPPGPEVVLPRRENSDAKTAQEIMDNHAEELKAIAAASELMEADEEYYYRLNFTDEFAGADDYIKQLETMPQELADALRETERRFPEWGTYLLLRKGQIGVNISDGSLSFSYLCYPGEELLYFQGSDEAAIRRRDMGGGWELQMYYAPKG